MKPKLTPGMPIFTADGVAIGTVLEVRDDAFKVSRDYWLPCDSIATTIDKGVRLTFPKDRLGEHRCVPV